MTFKVSRGIAVVLAAALWWVAGGARAAVPPTLFSVTAATPKVLAAGAQKSWPIEVSEDSALKAVFQGGMWLPEPAGGRVYATYQRHVLHADGTWTWVGKVPTAHGEQSVVLTFGAGGVFGRIPQPSGYPLRIVTTPGGTHVVATSAADMARSTEALRLQTTPDAVVPPYARRRPGARPAAPVRAPDLPARATGAGPVIIDVMVAYTDGYAASMGGQAAALTRIQNLVDITNQAYVDSGVNVQLSLVHAVEVAYPDNTSNDSALDDITGTDGNGNAVTVPASLAAIAGLRVQYGADLVALVRAYDNTTQGNCGEGWLNGAGQVPIVPAQASAFGYSVVSDGNSGGYYCLDTTLAHELGHNMGDDHDRAHAGAGGGAYPYSYGYVGNGTNGFATIMGYPTATDTPVAVFSNPNIATCQNTPCGVADGASNAADNAHGMNNAAALIAQFEPAAAGASGPAASHVHDDVNGDGKSDLLWYNATSHQMTYWLMNGATLSSWRMLPVPAGYAPLATGDFNGDGLADILWSDASGNLYVWLNNGQGAFTGTAVTTAHPAGKVIAAVDLDGNGDTDLVWYDATTGAITYWFMNGASVRSTQSFATSPGLALVATGDFDGSGFGDLLWKTSAGEMYMWLSAAGGTFTYHDLGPFPAGWVAAGTGDVNADGKTDLYWYNPTTGQMTYWLMNGAAIAAWQPFQTSPGLTPLATGLFDGADAGLTWKLPSGAMYMWWFVAGSPTTLQYSQLQNYPAGWVPIQ